MQTDKIDPKELSRWLVELGTDWAEKKHASDLLEDARKPLLAKLGAQCSKDAQSARDAYALAHPDYEGHCKAIADAAREAAIAKIKYEAALNYIELLRTASANERAALREAT